MDTGDGGHTGVVVGVSRRHNDGCGLEDFNDTARRGEDGAVVGGFDDGDGDDSGGGGAGLGPSHHGRFRVVLGVAGRIVLDGRRGSGPDDHGADGGHIVAIDGVASDHGAASPRRGARIAQHPAVGRDNVEARVGGRAVHGEQCGWAIALLNRRVDLVAVRGNCGVRRGALPPAEQLDTEKPLGARDQCGDADSVELDATLLTPFPAIRIGCGREQELHNQILPSFEGVWSRLEVYIGVRERLHLSQVWRIEG